MITGIVLKTLYVFGGAVVGWFAKRWHLQGYIDDINKALKEDVKTPPVSKT